MQTLDRRVSLWLSAGILLLLFAWSKGTNNKNKNTRKYRFKTNPNTIETNATEKSQFCQRGDSFTNLFGPLKYRLRDGMDSVVGRIWGQGLGPGPSRPAGLCIAPFNLWNRRNVFVGIPLLIWWLKVQKLKQPSKLWFPPVNYLRIKYYVSLLILFNGLLETFILLWCVFAYNLKIFLILNSFCGRFVKNLRTFK